MRVPITIKNTNKFGKATNKWFVRIGEGKWRTFNQEEWVKGGIAWINSQLTKSDGPTLPIG